MTETLQPGKASLAELERIYRGRDPVRIHPDCREAVMSSAKLVQESAAGAQPIYGVNTGFGKLAGIRIPPTEIEGAAAEPGPFPLCGTRRPAAGVACPADDGPENPLPRSRRFRRSPRADFLHRSHAGTGRGSGDPRSGLGRRLG